MLNNQAKIVIGGRLSSDPRQWGVLSAFLFNQALDRVMQDIDTNAEISPTGKRRFMAMQVISFWLLAV